MLTDLPDSRDLYGPRQHHVVRTDPDTIANAATQQ